MSVLIVFTVVFTPLGELKPSPLVLSTAGVENASVDSPLPLTPFVEQNTPKHQLGQSFDVSQIACISRFCLFVVVEAKRHI